MKKNLKKVTALALAALTVTSMSSATFAAKKGDVDNDSILTANDAAMIYQYSKDSDAATKKFGTSAAERIEGLGAVTFRSLVKGGVTASDASSVITKINNGGSFDENIQAQFKEELTNLLAGKNSELLKLATENGVEKVYTINQVKRDPETGLIIKTSVGTDSSADRELCDKPEKADKVDMDKAMENLTSDADLGSETYAVIFTLNKTPIRVELDSTSDSVIDKLDTALKGNTSALVSEGKSIATLLGTFKVDGVSLATEDGWKKLGVNVGASNTTAFEALHPVDADGNSVVNGDYVSNFVTNLKKALTGTAPTLTGVTIGKDDKVSLTKGGVTTTDATKVAQYIVDLLYNRGSLNSYAEATVTVNDVTFSVKPITEAVTQ